MEVLKLAPDVILTHSRPALAALQQATRAVPIVFTTINEPVAQGFVQSLAHPGGNITGFSYLEPTLGAVARAAEGDCTRRQAHRGHVAPRGGPN